MNSAEHAYNKAGKSGKKTKFIDLQTAAADAKADRERFYSIARQRAEAPAEQIRQRLRKDDQYSAAERNYNRLIPKIAAYEVHGQTAERDAAVREQKRWANVMARRMAAMNIRSEDLRPRVPLREMFRYRIPAGRQRMRLLPRLRSNVTII